MPLEIGGRNYRECLSALHHAIVEYPGEPIEVDFSECYGAMASGMVPLICWINDARTRGVDFDIIPPSHTKFLHLFRKSHWLEFLTDGRCDDRTRLHSGGIPLIHVTSEDGVLQAVDDVIETLLRAVKDIKRGNLQALEWSVNEILDNTFTHADASLGAYLQATIYPRRRVVDFVVSDNGMGIPKSMARIGIRDPAEAMIKAIEAGVTSRIGENKGNGLFGTYAIARESKGHFNLDSYHNRLYYSRTASASFVRNDKAMFPGTTVHWAIGLDDPDVIKRALVFSGKAYQMAFDYLDKRFASEAGNTHLVRVVDYRKDTITRIGGRRFRTMLENLLLDGSDLPVEITFSGINVISSSFADEVFAKIAMNHGEEFFRERVIIRDANETIQSIIAREIELRVL